jgi:hypothetical protein
MDEQALYSVLTILPQVSAALVAFIGFLGLNSLEEPLRRKAQIEQGAETQVRQIPEQHLNKAIDRIVRRPAGFFSGTEIMRAVHTWVKEHEGQDERLETLLARWSAVNCRIVKTRRALTVFISFHLVIIGVSLYLLPQSASLEKLPWLQNILPWLQTIWTGTVAGMFITTAAMIAVSFWSHSEVPRAREKGDQ